MATKTTKRLIAGVSATLMILGLNACGVSETTDDAATAATDGGGNGVTPDQLLEDNPLTAAYPSTLALAIFPQGSGTSLALQEKTDEAKLPEQKAEDRQKVLQGGSDAECFPSGLFTDRTAKTITCYEFDNDMNPYDNGPSGGGGTTTGKHTDGEACMVAFARQEVLDATQYVDRALDTVAGMLCTVKKAGGDTTLPAEDEEKDFTDDLADAATGITFTAAKMKNLGDGVYRSHIVLGDSKNSFDMTLVYKKGATEGESSGIISYKRARLATQTKLQEPGPAPQNPPPGDQQQPQQGGDENNTENMNDYVSVKFSQKLNSDGELRNRFEVRIASIVKTLDGFDSQGIIDYDVIPDNEANETANSFKYVQFDIDNETAEGDISYWRNPGGNLNERARGFIFNIAADETTGALTGCGLSGAADVSIRDTLDEDGNGSSELKPAGYWHPFAGNNTHSDKDPRYTGGGQGPLITSQCFTQNTTSGLYEIDYDATKALSDTTDEAAIDSRGYDVIPQETGNGRIQPPPPPEAIPEGEFKPAE